jgi:hypothetical protein
VKRPTCGRVAEASIRMPHPLTLTTLAGLAAAGSVTGVYLGRSAVAEINPAYYDEPETRFHADLAPHRPGFEAPQLHRAGALSPADRAGALGSGCVGCRTYPEEYYPVHDSSVDKYQPGYAAMIEAPDPQPAVSEPDPREKERAADFAAVERYAGYPVAEETVGEDAAAPEIALASVPVAEDASE